ncbi:MAG: DUF4230 domain-containing protein [Bacteroidota bacterium]|nr:DUF4230 domain-containing protein [Bacteroidota bacterium]
MGNLIGKGASLVLQIIFVVAAVLVFSWFDPLDILLPTKRTLKNTPVQVQSIREIGQLITSEYYGEVISSLKEVISEKDYNEMQEFNYIVDDLHYKFKLAISDFADEDFPKNKNKIFNAFKDFNPEITNHPLFDEYLYYIFEKIKDRNYKRNEINQKLDDDKQKILIKRLYLNRFKWQDQLFEIETNEFKTVKKETVKRASNKEYRKSRLVLIGRGWVKAGFDFGEFSNRNFKYDKKYKRIHFIGLRPKIISATINPWFIPEEGVEGFEFLIAERGARLKPKYTKMVKQRCLDKLQQQAMNKQILVRSQKNAETHLKAFFSLLLDEEIKAVSFHTDFLDYTLDVILKDSLIRNEEVFTIDSSLCYFYDNYKGNDKYEKLAAFIGTLQNAKTVFYGIRTTLNNRSSLLFSIIKDRTIDSVDIAWLDEQSYLQHKDTLWYSKIIAENCFNTSNDTLSQKKKLLNKINKKFDDEQKRFCADLNHAMKLLKIDVDTNYFKNSVLMIKLHDDSCKLNIINNSF